MLKRSVFFLPLLAACASAAEPVITYDRHIKPIFREHCMKCHGEDDPRAGLNLSTHATVLKGGSVGAVVVAGRASASLLFKAITDGDEDKRMSMAAKKEATLAVEREPLVRLRSGLRQAQQ